jgi:hypothetical protein
VYAAYLAYTDYEIGRVIQAVQDMGNTLIIYISGDNGSSAEGSPIGTPNEVAAFNSVEVPVADQLKSFYDVWGSDRTYNHMAVGWTWAFGTPYRWTKQVASHFGGTRNGMAIAWPQRIKDAGGLRHQFHHVIDVVPTILEATGVSAPATVDGIALVRQHAADQPALGPRRHAPDGCRERLPVGAVRPDQGLDASKRPCRVQPREEKRMAKTLPFLFPEDETFDVGVDTRTPIDDRDYQVPFRFQGKLAKLTVELQPIRGTLAQIIEFKWKTRD